RADRSHCRPGWYYHFRLAGVWPRSEAKTMTIPVNEFNETSKNLLEKLRGRLGDEDQQFADEYWGHGEWGLLMEVILDSLTREQIALSQQEYDLVKRLVMHFQPPHDHHDFINNREEALAALNVVEDR